jgi:hypothetical protein
MNLANSIVVMGLVSGLFTPAYASCPVNPNTTLVRLTAFSSIEGY